MSASLDVERLDEAGPGSRRFYGSSAEHCRSAHSCEVGVRTVMDAFSVGRGPQDSDGHVFCRSGTSTAKCGAQEVLSVPGVNSLLRAQSRFPGKKTTRESKM